MISSETTATIASAPAALVQNCRTRSDKGRTGSSHWPAIANISNRAGIGRTFVIVRVLSTAKRRQSGRTIATSTRFSSAAARKNSGTAPSSTSHSKRFKPASPVRSTKSGSRRAASRRLTSAYSAGISRSVAPENSQTGSCPLRSIRSRITSISPAPPEMVPTVSSCGASGLVREPSVSSLICISRAGSMASSTTYSCCASCRADEASSRVSRYCRATSRSSLRAASRNPSSVPRGVSRPSGSVGRGVSVGAAGAAG